MNQASRDLIHIAGWGVSIVADLFGGWWQRRGAKRNAELREVLRLPSVADFTYSGSRISLWLLGLVLLIAPGGAINWAIFGVILLAFVLSMRQGDAPQAASYVER